MTNVTTVEDHGRREPCESAGANGICSWQDLAISFPKHFRMCFLSWQSGILVNPHMFHPGFQAWPGAMRQADAGRVRRTPLRIQFFALLWHLWLCLAVCSNPMVEICIDEQEQEGKEPPDLRTTSSHFKCPLCACSDPLVHGQELRQQGIAFFFYGPSFAGHLRFTGWSGPPQVCFDTIP